MMINESAIIADFCSDFAPADQGLTLWPHNGKEGDTKACMETAKLKLQMQRFDKLAPYFAKAMFRMYKEEESMKDLKENGLAEFEKFITDNLKESDGYLSGGKEPMYIDIHVFPILERMVLLEGSPWDYAAKELNIKENSP